MKTFFRHRQFLGEEEHRPVPHTVESFGKQALAARGYTECFDIDDDARRIYLGISICSIRDQFSKKVGRIKAQGHAKSQNALVLHDVPKDLDLTSRKEVLTYLEKTVGILPVVRITSKEFYNEKLPCS